MGWPKVFKGYLIGGKGFTQKSPTWKFDAWHNPPYQKKLASGTFTHNSKHMKNLKMLVTMHRKVLKTSNPAYILLTKVVSTRTNFTQKISFLCACWLFYVCKVFVVKYAAAIFFGTVDKFPQGFIFLIIFNPEGHTFLHVGQLSQMLLFFFLSCNFYC